MHADMQPCVEHLFNLSVDMLCLAEIDGCFLLVNPSWSDSLGWSEAELLSMRWRELVHPDDEESVRSVCRRLLSGEQTDQCMIRCRRKDGQYIWTSWKAATREGDTICAVVREVEDNMMPANSKAMSASCEQFQQMEEEHKAALRELEILVYTVSHDVRTPIWQIIQFADMTVDALSDESIEKASYFVYRIRKIARNTSQLLIDLLWFSQASSAPLDRDICDLNRLAIETFEDISNRYPGRRFEIHVDQNMRVVGDMRLLRILLNNLIDNACKFTAEREVAEIRITMREEKGLKVYSIHDNGAGFDSSRAEALFAPFIRAHPSDRFEGTGIGLATARRIVERHGGEIWAESGGDGAVFSFTLGKDSSKVN